MRRFPAKFRQLCGVVRGLDTVILSLGKRSAKRQI
jgi:hypothetical protein